MPAPERALRPARTGVALVALLLVGLAPLATSQSPVNPSPVRLGGPALEVFGPFHAIPAGDERALLLIVANDGPGDVFDVEASFSPDPASGLLVVGFDNVRRLGAIPENESEGIVLTVATPQVPGGARLFVTLTSRDGSDQVATVTREIAVRIGPERVGPLDVDLVGSDYRAGEEAVLHFRLRNRSPDPLHDIALNLDTPETNQGFAGSSGFVGGLGGITSALALLEGGDVVRGGILLPRETASASVRVKISLDAPDVVPFSVRVTYGAGGFARNERFDFAVSVTGSVSIRVLDLREERDAQTDRLHLRGVLANVGAGTAWNPRVRVPPDARYAETEHVLIEDMEPNEPVSFSIPITEGPNASAEAPVIEVEWNDEFGTVRRLTLRETARAAPPEPEATWYAPLSREIEARPLIAGILGAALVLALVHLAQRIGAARKKRGEDRAGQ